MNDQATLQQARRSGRACLPWIGLAFVLLMMLCSGAAAAPPAAQAGMTLDMVGHLGGDNGAVFVQGSYAYATFNRELAVLDLSDPTHPARVGYVALPGFAHDVHVVGGYAYVTNYHDQYMGGGDLVVVSVADPAGPVIVGSVTSQINDTRSAHIAGNYAYLVGDNAGLAVIDISDPTDPTETGFTGGVAQARDIFAVGNYAYVATDPGLAVIDVSDPANPALAATLAISGTTQGLYVSGDYAYVTTEVWNNFTAHNLYVVDISNPTSPAKVGSARLFGGFPARANGVHVSGSYAYVAGSYWVGYPTGTIGAMQVVDISNPGAPAIVDLYTTYDITEAYRIHVSGNHAFLTCSSRGLLVMDVSDPSNPTQASLYRVPAAATSLALSGSHAYMADAEWGFKAVDVSDPVFPFVAGFRQTAGSARDVEISGQYAYVAEWGLLVLDISDPAGPVQVVSYLPPGESLSFSRIYLSGHYAYLIDSYLKLWILDIANPAAPAVASSLRDSAYSFIDVSVAGGHAYLVGYDGLRVFDVSDPTQPAQVAHLTEATDATAVAVAGDYAYVAGSELYAGPQFWVVDVSDPAAPAIVGTYVMEEDAYGLMVSGSYAYVSICNHGLIVLDVSNPHSPALAGAYNTVGCTKDSRVAGSTIYLADSDNGLVILTRTALQVSPSAVTWLVEAGGPDPRPRAVAVESTGSLLTWTAVVSPTVDWLAAAPLDGVTPAAITLTAQTAGLAVGQYHTQLVVSSEAGVEGSPQTIPVTLIVADELTGVYLPLILRGF